MKHQANKFLPLLALLTAVPTLGAAPALEFRPVGENRGLDVAMPVDVMFDSRGFLWVGGRSGLHRYDGYRAVLFEPDAANPDAITDLDIRALYEDADGDLWVATNTGGLNRLDPETGRFAHYRHQPGDPATLNHDSVYEMAEGPGGDLWAGTQIGLSRIDRDTGVVTRYRSDPDDPASLGHDYVFSVYRDRQDVMWVATIGGGLNRYNSVADNFTRFDLADLTGGSDERNDVFQLAEDGRNRLWVGTRDGLLRLDGNRVNFSLVDLGLPGGAQPTITELLIDADDNVWVGTLNGGVIRIDAATGAPTAYTDYDEREIGGLASQPVLSLAMANDVLFVGTWGAGLWSARIPDTAFTTIAADNSELRNDLVTAVHVDAATGNVLTGSFGGGLQAIDVPAGSVADLPAIDAALLASGVLDIAQRQDGGLFVATDDGLYELAADGARVRRWAHDPDDPNAIGEGYVTSLLLADSTLWVGVGGSGLHRLDLASGMLTAYRHDSGDAASLSGDYVTSLLADGQDRLWVGTRSNGLNLCELRTMRCQSFSGGAGDASELGHFHVTALYKDSRGRRWVATDGGGLHEARFDGDAATPEFTRWTERDGLLSDSVMAIEEDGDGSLWLSSRHGLTRFDPDQGRVVNYVEAGGLPVGHFNARAAASDADNLYFGSVRGLLVIPRGTPFVPRAASPVRITGVETIGAEALRPGTGWVPETFRSDYGDMLAIGFATLDYAEVPHEYQFRLDEDDDWSALGQRNELTLLKLAPGAYRLTARGRDIFGAWNESQPLTIEVVPPFWMSAWFRAGLVLLLIGLGFAAHRLRTRRLKARAREIERLGARREASLEKALGGKSELAGLTPRQKEVLQLIAEGHSTREIAGRLDVSVKTVETHRAHLMDRLDIRDVPGLVRLAIRAGLISPHD